MDVEIYNMKSKPRGLVLIVCITEYTFLKSRESAINDKINMQTIFEKMGYEVTVTYEYLEQDKLRTIVREFAERNDFREVDSCFVIFSCHGFGTSKEWDAEIAASNYDPSNRPPSNERIYCSEIVDYFSSTNCPHLIGKPKVFFFQMCRTNKEYQNSESKIAVDVVPFVQPYYENIENIENTDATIIKEETLFRKYEDTLIVHSTNRGHCSYRDLITGSNFIHILCKVIKEEADKKDLCLLLNKVDRELKDLTMIFGHTQTLEIINIGFNKLCYLKDFKSQQLCVYIKLSIIIYSVYSLINLYFFFIFIKCFNPLNFYIFSTIFLLLIYFTLVIFEMYHSANFLFHLLYFITLLLFYFY